MYGTDSISAGADKNADWDHPLNSFSSTTTRAASSNVRGCGQGFGR